MTDTKVSAELKRQADEIHGLVVEHIEDGEVTVVERAELLVPARAQRVLYEAPVTPETDTFVVTPPEPAE